MTDGTGQRLAWEQAFLAALAKGQSVRKAAKAAGVAASTAYWHRNHSERFACAWRQACATAGKGEPKPVNGALRSPHWRKAFLEALAETSNVTASAARVNVPARTVYKLRREDADFAARWLAALHEGYDNLEMELLGYLREPEPQRKMDVAAALRLLAAHRDTVERRRALMEEDDEQAVRASIDAFLEGMRQRRLANEAILIEAEARDVSE